MNDSFGSRNGGGMPVVVQALRAYLQHGEDTSADSEGNEFTDRVQSQLQHYRC